jgi:hypothetical protein
MEFEQTLLYRNRRGLTPTDAGKRLARQREVRRADGNKNRYTNILNLLKRSEQGPDISIAIGKDPFEIALPNSEALPPSLELELPWHPLADAVQPGDCNLLDALRWNFGLVEKLYGRDGELQQIIDWAERRLNIPRPGW